MSRQKKVQNQSKSEVASRSIASNARYRTLVLLATLSLLLIVFVFRGGVTGFATSMAENAILRRKIGNADRWLSVAKTTLGDQSRVEFLRARIARLNGDFTLMLEHLVKANELGHDPKLLDREQVLANLSIGEMDTSSEAMARQWIAELPDDVGLIVDAFANGLASQSRFQEAAMLLEEYGKAFPRDAMVNYRFGVMNEHIRGNARAEQEYKLALEKDPAHVQAAWRLARLMAGKNDPNAAIELLERFDYGKQSLAIKTFLAHCFQQAGEPEKSRALFKIVADQGQQAALASYRAVDEVPERFLAASELGVLDVKLGNWEEAKTYLELALEFNPRDFIARNSYGQVLRRLGLHEQAEKELARIIEERQEYDKITVLRDQINQDQSNTQARVQMGKILYKYESERFGLFWIRSALAQDPKCQEAHQFLGEYYARKAAQATTLSDKHLYQAKANDHFGQIETAPASPTP